MHRTRLNFLKDWLASKPRKPVIIRGARQVGKTWLVRHLSEISEIELFEINFEKRPDWAPLFIPNDPAKILINLEAAFGRKIDPNTSLLFLDEIQVCPELLAKLRWFAEEMPQLRVIAAGSLLDFVLEKHTFSMPVGRVHYLHLEPMSYEEFLLAKGKDQLLSYLEQYEWQAEFPQTIHNELIALFREYLIVGGMPEAVYSWVSESSLTRVNQVHHDLMATYRDDFAKFAGRMDTHQLEEVMMAVPSMLGTKFVYSRVSSSTESVKKALGLLEKARICTRVCSSAANGVPLAAEVREKFFKVFFLDVGLNNAALGLTLNQISAAAELTLVHKGGVAEQVVSQLLKTVLPPYIEPYLHYWHREKKGASAEVDFVIQHANKVVPVEVKAGSTGSLKSLHVFMGLKNSSFALRINADFPTCTRVNIKDHTGAPTQYTLLSLPFYLIGQVHRLINAQMVVDDIA